MKISIAQINSIVGDIPANTERIIACIRRAESAGVDLLIFPELALTGYPLNDLVYELQFLRQQETALAQIAQESKRVCTIVGAIEFNEAIVTHDRTCEKFNSAFVFQNGKCVAKRHKSLLPNYDVFHEQRYFTAANTIEPVELELAGQKRRLGIEICEDLWDDHYDLKVTRVLAEKGADMIINISASPFEIDKYSERRRRVEAYVRELAVPFVYCNLVGGQDEIVFDGNSFAYNKNGKLIAECRGFLEDNIVFTLEAQPSKNLAAEKTEDELLFNALVLGVKDYFAKNGFQKAVLGLSGGVDSALVAAIAAEAIGAENVTAISLPSEYSTDHSKNDAKELAENYGMIYKTIAIELFHALFKEQYGAWFQGQSVGLADENIQARLRGLILMLISNQEGKILLSTGNKTEIALGYCTLYGDMNGALSVIGDLSKTRVYNVCRYINSRYGKTMIPENIITKAPSAELRDGQVDPFDYDHISPLVDKIIEARLSKEELLAQGYNSTTLDDLFKRLFNNEFKRFQSAIILKVTSKSFGLGRLYPITNHYKG